MSDTPRTEEERRVRRKVHIVGLADDLEVCADLGDTIRETCANEMRWLASVEQSLYKAEDEIGRLERELADKVAECERLRSVAPDSAEVEAIAVYLEGLENYKDAALLRSLDMAHKLALGLGNLQRERAESAEAKLYKSQMDRTNLEADCEAQRAKLRRVADIVAAAPRKPEIPNPRAVSAAVHREAIVQLEEHTAYAVNAIAQISEVVK